MSLGLECCTRLVHKRDPYQELRPEIPIVDAVTQPYRRLDLPGMGAHQRSLPLIHSPFSVEIEYERASFSGLRGLDSAGIVDSVTPLLSHAATLS